MGNVIAAQRTKNTGSHGDHQWNNGSLFGAAIEEILIKDNVLLQKRACCMGVTEVKGSDQMYNDGINGLEVPIANIGVGYDTLDRADSLTSSEKWKNHVKNLHVGRPGENKNPFKTLTEKEETKTPEEETKTADETADETAEEETKTADETAEEETKTPEEETKTADETADETADDIQLYADVLRNYKRAADNNSYMAHGMVVKNVSFSKESVGYKEESPEEDENPGCLFDPTEDADIGFDENTQNDEARKYTSYSADKTEREKATQGERATCDNFMRNYAKHTVGEENRNCITTCGEVRTLPDEEMESYGFDMACLGKLDDKKIIDVRKPGCNDDIATDSNLYGRDPTVFHAAFNYPNDVSCLLSPYGSLYNDNNEITGIGDLFGTEVKLQKQSHNADPYCIHKKNYGTRGNAAYLDHTMLTQQLDCMNVFSLSNVSVNAGKDVNITPVMNNSCANEKNDKDSQVNGAPLNDTPGGGTNGGGTNGGGTNGGDTNGSVTPTKADATRETSGKRKKAAKLNPLPPAKRQLIPGFDDEMVYGAAGIAMALISL